MQRYAGAYSGPSDTLILLASAKTPGTWFRFIRSAHYTRVWGPWGATDCALSALGVELILINPLSLNDIAYLLCVCGGLRNRRGLSPRLCPILRCLLSCWSWFWVMYVDIEYLLCCGINNLSLNISIHYRRIAFRRWARRLILLSLYKQFKFNLITLIRMLWFGTPTHVWLTATPGAFLMRLPRSQTRSLLLRVLLLQVKLMTIYYAAVHEWHAASMRASMFLHDEFPVDSHFKLRWVHSSPLYQLLMCRRIYVPNAWGTAIRIMCDCRILRVGRVNRKTRPVATTTFWVLLNNQMRLGYMSKVVASHWDYCWRSKATNLLQLLLYYTH